MVNENSVLLCLRKNGDMIRYFCLVFSSTPCCRITFDEDFLIAAGRESKDIQTLKLHPSKKRCSDFARMCGGLSSVFQVVAFRSSVASTPVKNNIHCSLHGLPYRVELIRSCTRATHDQRVYDTVVVYRLTQVCFATTF